MPVLEELCRLQLTLSARVLGTMPQGTRIDFPFEGTATSAHWEGARPVKGMDYVIVRSDGHSDLNIYGTIGEKRETLAYRATGVALTKSKTEALPQELISFQTANEDLAWLNSVIGVGFGEISGSDLALTIYVVRP